MQEKEKIDHFSNFLRAALVSPNRELERVRGLHAQRIKNGKSVVFKLLANKVGKEGLVYTPPIKLINFQKLSLREKLTQYGATVQALSINGSQKAHAFTINFDQHETNSFIERAQSAPMSEKTASEFYAKRINDILNEHFSHYSFIFENAPLHVREDGSRRENMIHIHGVLLASSDTPEDEIREILNKVAAKLRKRGKEAPKGQVSLQNAYFPAGFLDYALAVNIDGKKQANDKVFNLPRSGKRIRVSSSLVKDAKLYHQAAIETLSETQHEQIVANTTNHKHINKTQHVKLANDDCTANHLLQLNGLSKQEIEAAVYAELDALLDEPDQDASKPQISPFNKRSSLNVAESSKRSKNTTMGLELAQIKNSSNESCHSIGKSRCLRHIEQPIERGAF